MPQGTAVDCRLILPAVGLVIALIILIIPYLPSLNLHFIFVPAVHSFVSGAKANRSYDKNHTAVNWLREKVRVLCWVATSELTHENRALHVKATWSKRCNKCLFMSSVYDPRLPTVALNVSEGRNHLWGKTKAAFRYIYSHEDIDTYDWFLKTDDDTYVIMDNLRYMLLERSAEELVYFGSKIRAYPRQSYQSGGAGYVLSRAAFKKMVTKGLPNGSKCRLDDAGFEDEEMGACLNNIGVNAGDTRDPQERHRFLPALPSSFLIPNPSFLFYRFTFYPMQPGFNCCSSYPVSFHYVSGELMHTFDYLIYNTRVFGMQEDREDVSND